MPMPICKLLEEDGFRWLSADEQRQMSHARDLLPYMPRPVWLYLAIVLRAYGIRFDNGVGVSGHMRNMREAYRMFMQL